MHTDSTQRKQEGNRPQGQALVHVRNIRVCNVGGTLQLGHGQLPHEASKDQKGEVNIVLNHFLNNRGAQ